MYFQISCISFRQTFSRKFCCSPHTWMLLNHFWLSCIQDLTSLHLPLCRPSARLSGRLDKELAINLTLSVNLIWYFMVFPIFCFSIDTEKVMFFTVFSHRHLNCSWNLSASCSINNSIHKLTYFGKPTEFLSVPLISNYLYC